MTDDNDPTDTSRLDGRAMARAGIVTLLAFGVVILAWLALGILLFAVAGDRGLDAVSRSQTGQIAAHVLLLLPILAGAWRLSREVEYQLARHCLVFGVVAAGLIVLPAILSGGINGSWWTLLYYAAIIPTALAGGAIGAATRARRAGRAGVAERAVCRGDDSGDSLSR